MKKVLILAYDFPPYVSVGGLRPYSWYRYFQEFDIYPIIITRQWSNALGNHLDYISAGASNEVIIEENEYGTIVRAPYKPNIANRIMLKYGESRFRLIRKIISAYYEFAQFVFPVGPKSTLYFAANDYLKKNKVDAIIATGDPFVLFKYSSTLSEKYNTPWIADYRDQWSQNLYTTNAFLIKKWHAYLEFNYVKSASAVITVSDFLRKKIGELITSNPFYILPNGYDPESIKNLNEIKQQSDILNIAFVGSIYDYHPLRSFLKQVSLFIEANENVKIKINFFGINLYGVTFKSDLNTIIITEFPNIINYVEVYKKMPNNLLLIELSKQNIMLLFNQYSYMGTKIFDYIALKRTILFCYSNDDDALKLKDKYYDIKEISDSSGNLQEELIRQTDSGYIIQDSNHLQKTLSELYQEFIQNGFIKCNTTNGDKYSRKHQVKELAEIIKTKI